MLHELHAEAFAFDPASDTVRVKAPGAAGKGRLGLFDAKGFLVGVDLRDDDGRGTVVMLGPHEAVSETRDVDVRVDGEGLVIAAARATVRGGEQSPYG